MPNEKVTDLTALTAPALEDVLMIVDDPSGTPVSKKITLQDVLRGQWAWAQIYTASGVGTQSLSAATWTKVTQFDSDGDELNATADAANDRITLDVQGRYFVMVSVSFTPSAGSIVDIAAYLDSGRQEHIRARAQADPDNGEPIQLVACGFINVDADAENLEVYAYTDGADNFNVIHASLVATRVPY